VEAFHSLFELNQVCGLYAVCQLRNVADCNLVELGLGAIVLHFKEGAVLGEADVLKLLLLLMECILDQNLSAFQNFKPLFIPRVNGIVRGE